MIVKEEMVRLCAWCNKVFKNGKWVHVTNYVNKREVTTTYGICEDCANKEKSK